MTAFFVTFGSQYGRDHFHPRFLPAHHDGYLRVEADDVEHAKRITESVVGLEYSMLYERDSFPFGLYPLGELAAFSDLLHAPIEQDTDGQRHIVCSCSLSDQFPISWGEKGHGD